MDNIIQVKTGGKLYIAGEYAILTPSQSAIIKNIPIYITATIKSAKEISIWSDMFAYCVGIAADSNYSLIQETITVLANFLGKEIADLSPFSLEINGELGRDGKKFGIGSSGSVTILTLKALSRFYQLDLSTDTIFKLAAYTLIKRGDNGSMGDLACIAYDNLVYFTAFDRQLVRTWIVSDDLRTVLERDWGYRISVLYPKIACDFLVGWTKQPSISNKMVNLVKSSITPSFLKVSQENVEKLSQGLLNGQKDVIKESLATSSQLLENLNPAIYTERLRQLKAAEKGLDVIAKSSGSGGGDCGIALSFKDRDSHLLVERWQKAGIELLYQEKL
ncbi:phosphomevalonate kinase [Streptococcus mutans]|uniref:phosphomevalonate kinase n=1 Tax=Streptococcus mutans TaxID=1309 RepID=UPI00030E2585|nr:phosphomevalonate kinase [Streptococcus mutans]MDP5866416.1 phosphomevalonate kinase [Streptococcus mutans]